MRSYYGNLRLLALLLGIALVVASCAGSSGQSAQEGSSEESSESTQSMASMDHGGMTNMMGEENSKAMAAQMVAPNGEYSDEYFIDAMVAHHQGAIDMANVALQNAEHPEILQLAQNIIATQQAEIDELKAIKQREFGTSEVPMELSSEHVKMMGMMEDPSELANQRPFDKAFIDAMIPHHSSAIEMAQVAYEETSDDEIRTLSQNIIDAQVGEIEQMTGWRAEWYPEGER